MRSPLLIPLATTRFADNSRFRTGRRLALGCGAAALAIVTSGAVSAAPVPQSGPAKDGSPAWFIYQPQPADLNRPRPPQQPQRFVAACAAESAKLNASGPDQRNTLMANYTQLSSACQDAVVAPNVNPVSPDQSGIPTCVRSAVCGPTNGQGISWRTNPGGVRDGNGGWIRVEWRSNPVNLGYTISYPYELPKGANGAVAVAVDSKDNLWVLQRSPIGAPALTKFGPDRKMLFTLGDDVIGHQNKAHGMNVDPEDNVYICDPSSSTVMKVSPEGKLLMTIGTKGKRGDWDEAKGQRLLWQPVAISFAANGDIFIGEGHANESPNDTQSGDPANLSGAARVIHLDKTGKFINQIYGNMTGAGKFSMVHDLAIDPKNGDLWIGDREQYRFVLYNSAGEFVRTIQMRNLTDNIAFDRSGDPWMGSGGDGQILKIDRNGKVLAAIGNGPGNGDGQLGETGYIRWDSKGTLYTGSTTQARVSVWTPPARR